MNHDSECLIVNCDPGCRCTCHEMHEDCPVDWDIAPGGLQAAAFPETRKEAKQTGLF